MINGVRVEELSKDDEFMPEKFAEEETVIRISDLQRLKVLHTKSSTLNLA